MLEHAPLHTPLLSLVVGAVALLFPGPSGAQLTEPLSECSLEGLEEPALCGGLEVPEDPARPEGRTIELAVAVLPALDGDADAPPLAILAGGPGAAATGLADFAAAAFAGVRDERALLFVDARGTGGSNPLDCASFSGTRDPGELLGPLFSEERVRRCRGALQERADLSLYTTTHIADDMVRVWRALGHERVDVYGTSYGTRVALEIMRRSPESLRSVVLKGVAPMELRMPLDYPRDGQRSLDRILEHCRAEPECARAYPRLEVELHEVLAALRRGVDVRLRHPETGEAATVRVEDEPVTQALMAALQSTELAVWLPRMIHAAARGGWEPLTSFALFYRVALAAELHEGMFLSVTCREDLPFIDPDDARRVAEDTFLGLARWADQAAACEIWDVPPVDPGFREPVTSSVPTLVISGNYDPVTPPRWGWKALERLENAHHLVVPEGSHSFSGMQGCVDVVIARFVRTGDPMEAPDPCVFEQVRLPDFPLPEGPWPPMIQAPEGGTGG